MTHYVLLSRSRSISPKDRQFLAGQPGVQIVDEVGARALLVDATEDAAETLRAVLTDWIITRETVYSRSMRTKSRAVTKSRTIA